MLFRPTAQQNLAAIQAQLDAWNGEADSFRHAALAAKHGQTPSSLTVNAAEEAHDSLNELLLELDRALDTLPPGHADFGTVLKVQTVAMGLLESIGNSHDALESFAAQEVDEPVWISHPLRVAAE